MGSGMSSLPRIFLDEPGDTDIDLQTQDRIFSGALPANVYPPPDSLSFDPTAYIALPAIGATTAVLTFTVDDGFIAVIKTLGNVFVGTGWTEGSGALVWQLLDNNAVVRNYDNVISSLGSVQQPQPIGGGGGVLIQEGHVVTLQVNNVSLAVGGAQVGARLGGWFFPKWRLPDPMATF